MARIKMHIPKAKLSFYPPYEVKYRLQNGVSTTTLRPGSTKTWDEMLERLCISITQVRTRSPSKAFRW